MRGGDRSRRPTFRRVADEHGALFIVNDDPDLARACGADGVHVGQDDAPSRRRAELLGPDAIVGLSTHSAEQIEAAAPPRRARPTTSASGPIWETPTKAGRPATGSG